MARGSVRLCLVAAAAMVLAAGCTQTSRVDDSVSTGSLAETRKAVAVMRVGAASPDCIHVAVLLGVREGEGFRRRQGLTVMNVRSLTEPAVAEVELDPGEYHVLAYRCQTAKSIKTVDDNAGGQLYRTSFASFTLQPGEIVNVGYLHLVAWRHGRNTFGRPVEMDIEVKDWPLAELDRFKAKRPHIYAQMKTRLMTVASAGQGSPTSQDCARLKALKAEGKVQQLPPECVAPAASKRAPAAVAKQNGT
ncbi:MAG TPA: hypothetical protein VJ233_14570 [Hyphomicrobiaceae bacterium]|nr:hypothetical protein [Hyphomicrobiaceae bacterium]